MKTVKVDRKDLKDTHTPILDHCRTMIAEGEDPETMLEVWRGETLSMRMPIGEGSKLSVTEDPIPRFVKHKEMSEKDRARLASRRGKKPPPVKA